MLGRRIRRVLWRVFIRFFFIFIFTSLFSLFPLSLLACGRSGVLIVVVMYLCISELVSNEAKSI